MDHTKNQDNKQPQKIREDTKFYVKTLSEKKRPQEHMVQIH